MDELSPLAPQESHPESPLRVGVLAESCETSQHVYDFLEWARSHPRIVLSHLILHHPRPELKNKSRFVGFMSRSIRLIKAHGLYFIISERMLQIVERLEQTILKKERHHAQHLRKCDLSSLVSDTISVSLVTSDGVSDCHLNASDVRLINELNLDLLVSFGPPLLARRRPQRI